MDLFAPCRSCLQCLPFFNPSPPAAQLTASEPANPDASKATSVDPALASKTLPSPTPAAAPAAQEQDLCPPLKAEQEPEDAYSGIVIAPPVTSPHRSAALPEDADDDKATNLPELPLHVPYINDVTFPAPGSLPLQSPVTPAPFGAGYSGNQYPPPQYQVVPKQHTGHAQHVLDNSQHADEKSFHDDASAEHENSHSHHGHVNSEDGHVSPHYQIIPEQQIGSAQHILEDLQHVDEESVHDHASVHHEHSHSHHGHDHSHHELVNSEHGHVPQHSHVHALADYEVLHPDFSQTTQELQEDTGDHDSQQQSNVSTSVDNVGEIAIEHTLSNDKVDHTSSMSHLEVSQSTPEFDLEATIGGENSAGSHTNGASALLETYYSEPVVVVSENPQDIDDVESPSELLAHGGSHGAARRRRRDLLKNNFKGLKQQIKQGGLHLKEEGNKYMQTVIENVNKQAQQIDQSGSFFIVPRANNN